MTDKKSPDPDMPERLYKNEDVSYNEVSGEKSDYFVVEYIRSDLAAPDLEAKAGGDVPGLNDCLNKLADFPDEEVKYHDPDFAPILAAARKYAAFRQPVRADMEGDDRREIYNKISGITTILCHEASQMVQGLKHISPCRDDVPKFMPKGTPIKVLRMIQDEEDRIRGMGHRIAKAFHDLRAMQDDIYKALQSEPVRADGAWLPIETAPKDGTEILLCSSLIHDMGVCYWATDGKDGHSYWTWGCSREFLSPKYWMPLPKAPAEKPPAVEAVKQKGGEDA